MINRVGIYFLHNKQGFYTLLILLVLYLSTLSCANTNGASAPAVAKDSVNRPATAAETPKPLPKLDTILYNKLNLHLVHDSITDRWPVKAAYPLPGALLPFNRIIAYYGNFYTPKMGILGEVPQDSMLAGLMKEVKLWQKADTQLKVVPAIHYIAVTAQSRPGQGGKYRLRMPFKEIDKAIVLAKKINAIIFLDVQVGWGTVNEEIPALEPYLKMPNVHLGIDPEFSMKNKRIPCSTIGTMDAEDINFTAEYLAELVKKNNLPPKILIVHRFTKGMLTNYKNIKLHPEVQIVMHMDGFGFPAKKINSYKVAEVTEPVQYTGFKLFYKNDPARTPSKKLMAPEEIIKLYPSPVYIQYQ